MKLSRPLLAAALTSSLVLAACSGDENGSTSTNTPVTTTTDAVDATATETATDTADPTDAAPATATPADSAQQTSGPDAADDTQEPEPSAAVSIEDAEEIAATLLTQAEESRFAEGDERDELIQETFNGPARLAARGATRLLSVTGEPDGEAEEVEPVVLAISQDTGDDWKYIVAQTVPESGVPRLHLIGTAGPPENFRVIWEGEMLAGTEVGQFERRSVGSPVLGEDSGLYFDPMAVQRQLGRVLDYPIIDSQPNLRTSGYAPEVRDQARSQASAVSEQAVFTQTHEVNEDRTITIELADGTAISFGVLERSSVFDVRGGMELTPPDTFLAFVNDSSITSRAEVDWLVFTAVHIGTDATAPTLIAVGEQIVDANGS